MARTTNRTRAKPGRKALRFRSPLWYLRGFWNRHRVAYYRKLGNWMVRLATFKARSKLNRSGMITILVDANVFAHAVTHGTAWIDLEEGGGYLARVPVHHPSTKTPEYENIKYLAGIAHLARIGLVELVTSGELEDEQHRHPTGRFRGYGLFDYSLFRGIQIRRIDGIAFPTLGPTWMRLRTPREQQQGRLKARESDQQYASLVKALGPKNNQDAWHWYTAECHGLFCFLTMDFKLKRSIAAQAGHPAIKAMTTPVLTPAEFAKRFDILQVAPHLLSHEDADFVVHPTLSLPENRRRPKDSPSLRPIRRN